MIKRIIDISDAAYIHLKHKQLLIDKQGETVGQIPIEDLGVLILQNPAIVITQQVVIACQQSKVILIFCDNKHLPYSVILPIGESNNLHNKVLKQQINVSEPIKKNLWKQVIEFKIKNQAQTLRILNKDATQLIYLSAKVKSGDVGNCEAIAAQSYWKILFGEKFRRNPDLEGINSLLNYGYSIIRAMTARAVCGAGLHPTLGLFHSNQYNALCLADDLMEPFRPWVDLVVYEMFTEQTDLEINKSTKQRLLNMLSQSVDYNKKIMPLMVSCHYLMANLKRCYTKETKKLFYPVMEK